MSYLDLISDLEITDSENGSGYDKNDRNDQTLDDRPPCEHPLRLAESQAIGRCICCQSEAEFVEALGRVRSRRRRSRAAVTARVKQLRMDSRP
jgi:hypothetical protein